MPFIHFNNNKVIIMNPDMLTVRHIFTGQYDKCLAVLRESNKENMEAVRTAIFSHHQVVKKNELVIAIIDYVCRHEPGLTDDLQLILTRLTTLSKTENAKVALRARQVRFKRRVNGNMSVAYIGNRDPPFPKIRGVFKQFCNALP